MRVVLLAFRFLNIGCFDQGWVFDRRIFANNTVKIEITTIRIKFSFLSVFSILYSLSESSKFAVQKLNTAK